MSPIFVLLHASAPLAILLVSAFRQDPRKRWLDCTTVIWFVAFSVYANLLLYFEHSVFERNCDIALLHVDAAVGFHTLAFADALAKHPVFILLLAASYILESHVIAFAWVMEQSLQLRRAVLIAGFCCFALYLLFPAVGPGHFDWVGNRPEANAPLNCLPSMHFTWALLLLWNSKSVRMRVAMGGYLLLTFFSTLGLREHYLIDLIAAVPYAAVVQWVAMKNPDRFLKILRPDRLREAELRDSP